MGGGEGGGGRLLGLLSKSGELNSPSPSERLGNALCLCSGQVLDVDSGN